MIVQNVTVGQQTVTIFYPTLFVSSSSDKTVNINQITLTGQQNLEYNNIVTLTTENITIVPILKNN